MYLNKQDLPPNLGPLDPLACLVPPDRGRDLQPNHSLSGLPDRRSCAEIPCLAVQFARLQQTIHIVVSTDLPVSTSPTRHQQNGLALAEISRKGETVVGQADQHGRVSLGHGPKNEAPKAADPSVVISAWRQATAIPLRYPLRSHPGHYSTPPSAAIPPSSIHPTHPNIRTLGPSYIRCPLIHTLRPAERALRIARGQPRTSPQPLRSDPAFLLLTQTAVDRLGTEPVLQ